MSKPLTREEILECISYLNYAKSNIKEGDKYICVQLAKYSQNVLDIWDYVPKLEKYLVDWISSGLNDNFSLEGYIQDKVGYHNVTFDELTRYPTHILKVKNTRIKWINHMIKELKKEL